MEYLRSLNRTEEPNEEGAGHVVFFRDDNRTCNLIKENCSRAGKGKQAERLQISFKPKKSDGKEPAEGIHGIHGIP
ncbi:hypothetical protein [Noviherbaspirillum humi]|uniref:hypothetical protein n=1 Tax=Noviherbaspirillum humi TaxID=1688639 RepID=UPI001160A7DA|nr:hypothetical protein [Noviherbaspirillum humi]